MEEKPISIKVLDNIPFGDEESLNNLLEKEQMDFNRKIIVLDDDPTGTQTVHDIPVVTDWQMDTIREIFSMKEQMVFILTNSRSFSREYTKEVHEEIAEHIAAAARESKKDFLVISRGDSTLRGHFPLETESLRETLEEECGIKFHGEIICPFFKEGGRYTLNNIHYVKEGDFLVPAGQTEFARDKSFSYESSHLGEYVEEKCHGKYKKEDCIYISLEDLRGLELDKITEKLLQAKDFCKVIVNAVDYKDVKAFCICWIRAMKQGRNFLARSAAALARVIGGVDEIPLLTKISLVDEKSENGGLVIVGSHVKKSSDQLACLMESKANLRFVEFNVNSYFTDGSLEMETERVRKTVEETLKDGKSVVVYTSRRLAVLPTEDKDKILGLSVEISKALTDVVRLLSLKPRFIVAKGGITSSDVATRGLGIKKAMVMGQIRKGIPVWKTGPESKFPDMPYIIFPGNVGEVSTLREIVEELM